MRRSDKAYSTWLFRQTHGHCTAARHSSSEPTNACGAPPKGNRGCQRNRKHSWLSAKLTELFSLAQQEHSE